MAGYRFPHYRRRRPRKSGKTALAAMIILYVIVCLPLALASGLGKVGRPERGLQVLEEGFASVAKTGQRKHSPYLHHVKGELLLVQNPSDVAEAEQCFRTAIEIARGQSARTEELRATTSLARLLAKQGCRDEARATLA